MSSNLDVGPYSGGNTAVFQDVQASMVASQALTAFTDTVIQFNTEIIGKSFVSLSSNQFTLDEGDYIIKMQVNCANSGRGLIWVKDTSNVSYGGGHWGGNFDNMPKHIFMPISIPSGGKTIEFMVNSPGNYSFGGPTVSPTNGNEYYQQVQITKVG